MVYLGFTFNIIYLVLVYLGFVCIIQLVWLLWKTIEKNHRNYRVGVKTCLRINKQFHNV